MVEGHAGTLDIDAVDGGGTRVTLRMPLSCHSAQDCRRLR